jgi:diguanylate cyclase (GGDEF)-like protein
VTLATLGYVQLLGVLAVLVGDRRKRLKAESDLRHWSELLHHLGAGSPMATRIERPLEALWDEARGLLPDLQGLSAHGDPPVVLGRPEGYAFPLVREGAEVGHLHFARRPDGSDMLDALTPLFTQQVARMHEHAAWRVQAMTDALTGLHNRRGFELQLGRLLGRHADSGVPLAIAMLDLDHFKRINDVHGHPVGDRVLVLLARLLRDHVREGDVVVRWGGEEFLIVAAGLDAPLGAALLARLRQALRLATPTPLSRPLTFSAGLVVGDVPSEAATVFERIERADTALYAAKRAGRDRIEIASATRAERGEGSA